MSWEGVWRKPMTLMAYLFLRLFNISGRKR